MAAKAVIQNSFERILSKFPEKISLAFAYGSGVFPQNGHSSAEKNMMDFIFVVDDPLSWHKENIKINVKHYSFLKFGGARFIEKLQEDYGAKIYFNTLVRVDNELIKYGVISTHDLIEDLLDWQFLYVSGRMHKPVKILRWSKNEDIAHAMNVNLQSALHTSLLCLPEVFSEEELFRKIVSLSYSGDFRMYVGEDKQKIQNLVKPQITRFRKLYAAPMSMMPLVHWKCDIGQIEQDCSPSSLLHHLNLLPREVQHNLLIKFNKDGRYRDVEEVLQALAHDSECGFLVSNAVQDIVWWSSLSQSFKGIFTAGILKSLKYSSAKLVKMFRSLQKS